MLDNIMQIDNSRHPERFSVRSEPMKGGHKVIVYDFDKPCGSYEEYSEDCTKKIFEPFMVGDEWYALYVPGVMAIHIMSLPSCQDLGSEDSEVCGLYPMELYVPRYRLFSAGLGEDKYNKAIINIKDIEDALRRISDEKVGVKGLLCNMSLSEWRWCSFGFVSWYNSEDIQSRRVCFLDLSKSVEGVVRRQDRFGYAGLGLNDTLQDAVDMKWWSPHNNAIELRSMVMYSLNDSPP
jgi:hypothetical protein